MKTRKKSLPDWIARKIQYGCEDENATSAVVGVVALYIVGVIGLFVSKPFGDKDLWIETCFSICILALIIGIGYIFVARVTHLRTKREKVFKSYEKAKSDIEQAISDILKATTEVERSEAKRRKNEAEQRKAEWKEELDALFVKVKEDD